MDVGLIGGSRVLGAAGDVARIREAGRRRRLFKIAVVVLLVADYAFARWLGGDAVHWGLPSISLPQAVQDQLPAFILITVLASVLLAPMLMMGRSPHVMYRPSEISTTLDDRWGTNTNITQIRDMVGSDFEVVQSVDGTGAPILPVTGGGVGPPPPPPVPGGGSPGGGGSGGGGGGCGFLGLEVLVLWALRRRRESGGVVRSLKV